MCEGGGGGKGRERMVYIGTYIYVWGGMDDG